MSKPLTGIVKANGDEAIVTRVIELLERDFVVVTKSGLLLNDRDDGVHQYITIMEDWR